MPSENLISVFLNKIDGWGRKKIFFHIACLIYKRLRSKQNEVLLIHYLASKLPT